MLPHGARVVPGGGGEGAAGAGVSPADPLALSPRTPPKRREQADDVPPEAVRHDKRPAEPCVNPLPAQPLPGGDGHLQAATAREPRLYRPQRLRRALLLQARLLRRLTRDPRRLPAGASRLIDRAQPEGLQPVPIVRRQGGRGGVDAAHQGRGLDRQDRVGAGAAQHGGVPAGGARAADPASYRGHCARGPPQPCHLPHAPCGGAGGLRAHARDRADIAAGVHP
mmetsp:Transcript_25394/g.51603  ORF Transcript_25394/g.51603 Transcript_25394/m.51603 type:complete len:224 (+) Transcript_25394:463-1134(+)